MRPSTKDMLSIYQVSVESYDSMDMEGRILSIKLCEAPWWKTLLRYLSYICTGFIMYLLNLWFPSLLVVTSFTETSLSKAKWIVIYGTNDNIEVAPLEDERTPTKARKVFVYRLCKYFFDETSNTFRASRFEIEGLTCNDIHRSFGQGLDEQSSIDNTIIFGKNLTDVPKKSCLTLLIEEVLTPFYIFQVYCFLIWFLDQYYIYTWILIFFTVLSIVFTLYKTIETRNKLSSMSRYIIPVTVRSQSNGTLVKHSVTSEKLVPGDLIEIPEGALMPCDVVLLTGSCIMNESMLTGESIPIVKNPLPRTEAFYNSREDKQYTLFSGTKCIQITGQKKDSVALGLVTNTGFSTVKGELIRTMLFPKSTDLRFYLDSLKFIFGLGILAVISFIIDYQTLLVGEYDESPAYLLFIKASEFLTVAVPPALPTCLQIGISVALSSLKKKRIYCISPNKINEAGKISTMCFDKTGTLTEDDLNLFGVRPVVHEGEQVFFTELSRNTGRVTISRKTIQRRQSLLSQKQSVLSRASVAQGYDVSLAGKLAEILASCHSLSKVNDEMIGDPLDFRIFEATHWTFEDNNQEAYDSNILAVVKSNTGMYRDSVGASVGQQESKIGIIRRFDFSSKLQRMSVAVKDTQTSEFRAHIKGSPEKIKQLCTPESIPQDFDLILKNYATEGYRVLACGTKDLRLGYEEIMKLEREEFEKDFKFVSLIIMENKLKPITETIIKELQFADIKTIMVTGDNALTAINVARKCNIIRNSKKVLLGDFNPSKADTREAISWQTFLAPEELDDQDVLKICTANKLPSSLNNLDLVLPEHIPNSSVFNDDNLLVSESRSTTNKFRLSQRGLQTEDIFHTIVEQEPEPEAPLRAPLINPSSSFNSHQLNQPFHGLSDDDYYIALTGDAYSFILQQVEQEQSPEYKSLLSVVSRNCVVYARMAPSEKAAMIKHLMTLPKNYVGMCGDGANDVAALKTANVGISLTEAEASIAAPFTSNIQDISCVPTLLREGRGALSISYQSFKYMALFAIILLASMTIAYYHVIEFTNWQYYHIEIVVVLPLSATMTMSETYNQLTKQKPSGRLFSLEILTSVIGQGIIQTIFQCIAFAMLKAESWYDPENCADNFETYYACDENSTLFWVTIFQYTITCLVFMVGKPFKKPFYTNFWFTFSIIVVLALNTLTIYNPFDWQYIYDQDSWVGAGEVPMPVAWKNKLMLLILGNSVATIIWEELVVRFTVKAWSNKRARKNRIIQQ